MLRAMLDRARASYLLCAASTMGRCATYHVCDCTELSGVIAERPLPGIANQLPLPEKARLFGSFVCECCGELAGESWMRVQDGKKLCLDCWEPYKRFDV